MKLDKDIHTKLVNPQTSTALDSNVRNVLMALNGKAPYDRLLKMIESIKIWYYHNAISLINWSSMSILPSSSGCLFVIIGMTLLYNLLI